MQQRKINGMSWKPGDQKMEKLLLMDRPQKAKQVKNKTAIAATPAATRQLLELHHRMKARLQAPASTPLWQGCKIYWLYWSTLLLQANLCIPWRAISQHRHRKGWEEREASPIFILPRARLNMHIALDIRRGSTALWGMDVRSIRAS